MAANPQTPYPKRARLSTEELAQYRADPLREQKLGITDSVFCRECGEPFRMITARHLGKEHASVPSLDSYQQAWPDAPTVCAEVHKDLSDKTTGQWRNQQVRPLMMTGLCNAAKRPAVKKRRRLALRQAFKSEAIREGRRERLKAAWLGKRITSWLEEQAGKPVWCLIGGIYLLTNPQSQNRDLCEYLDRVRIKRKDGNSWITIATKPSVKNGIWELRKSVGIRGATFHAKPV